MYVPPHCTYAVIFDLIFVPMYTGNSRGTGDSRLSLTQGVPLLCFIFYLLSSSCKLKSFVEQNVFFFFTLQLGYPVSSKVILDEHLKMGASLPFARP